MPGMIFPPHMMPTPKGARSKEGIDKDSLKLLTRHLSSGSATATKKKVNPKTQEILAELDKKKQSSSNKDSGVNSNEKRAKAAE